MLVVLSDHFQRFLNSSSVRFVSLGPNDVVAKPKTIMRFKEAEFISISLGLFGIIVRSWSSCVFSTLTAGSESPYYS